MAKSNLINPWSLSTTARNPERLLGFLEALEEMEGEVWDRETQIRFQTILIQRRLYGYGEPQFYSGMDARDRRLIESEEPIAFADAQRIFSRKQYEDPPMRGRTSYKPLEKFGFARTRDKRLEITPLGRDLLAPDADLGNVLIKPLVKWQLPNPIDGAGFSYKKGYDIKPFVGVLRLIAQVNELCVKKGLNAHGISVEEFKTFGLTLIDWRSIEEAATQIVDIRAMKSEESKQAAYAAWTERFETRHLSDYGDNAIRYFRLTRFVRFRGEGRCIDLEPRREMEITALLDSDNASPRAFAPDSAYQDYLCDPDLELLPWVQRSRLIQAYEDIKNEFVKIASTSPLAETMEDHAAMGTQELVDAIELLRREVREFQRRMDSDEWQTPEKTRECADIWTALSSAKGAKNCTPPDLEYYAANALMSLDAAYRIIPNYPVGDDGRPTFTAPGNGADIECFYEGFNVACEVTLTRGSRQWVSETYPVQRHVKNFGQERQQQTYGLFLAPAIHEDTLDAFWGARQGVYQGEKIAIFPLTFAHFAQVIQACAEARSNQVKITEGVVKGLYDALESASNQAQNSTRWMDAIGEGITAWRDALLSKSLS